jgi:hypothetical protein
MRSAERLQSIAEIRMPTRHVKADGIRPFALLDSQEHNLNHARSALENQ